MSETIYNITKRYKWFLLGYLIMILFVIGIFYQHKNQKINDLSEEYKFIYTSYYQMIYENFKQISQNTFYGIINKNEMTNLLVQANGLNEKEKSIYREKLYKTFLEDFTRLQMSNFKQINFYFKDNIQFLQMNQKEVYGKNYSSSYGISKVNRDLKPIFGFENNKDSLGIRAIFPLFDDKFFHVGCVEIIVSTEYLEKSFEKLFHIDTHFITLKNNIVSTNLSYANDDYILESDDNIEVNHVANDDFYTDSEKQLIKEKMSKGENFAVVVSNNNKDYIVSFIPIIDTQEQKNSAYLVLYQESQEIEKITKDFYGTILLLMLFSFIFVLFTIKKYHDDFKLQQHENILKHQSKLASMGEMMANIVHQWRQPLSVISTLSTSLSFEKELGTLSDAKFEDYINKINDHVQYLNQTIEDFRNYYNQNKEKESFSLDFLLGRTLKLFKTTFAKHSIELVNKVDDFMLYSYPNELQQVLVNLIKNAIDAIGDNGIICICVKKEDNHIMIEVQDSGNGIPESILHHVFNQHFTTKGNDQGTGLGLYMSKEIVTESLHGTLSVRNEVFTHNFKEYYGAKFTIKLKEERQSE